MSQVMLRRQTWTGHNRYYANGVELAAFFDQPSLLDYLFESAALAKRVFSKQEVIEVMRIGHKNLVGISNDTLQALDSIGRAQAGISQMIHGAVLKGKSTFQLLEWNMEAEEYRLNSLVELKDVSVPQYVWLPKYQRSQSRFAGFVNGRYIVIARHDHRVLQALSTGESVPVRQLYKKMLETEITGARAQQEAQRMLTESFEFIGESIFGSAFDFARLVTLSKSGYQLNSNILVEIER